MTMKEYGEIVMILKSNLSEGKFELKILWVSFTTFVFFKYFQQHPLIIIFMDALNASLLSLREIE